MKRKIFIFLSLLFLTMSVSAQRVRFDLNFKSTVPANLSKVYVQPLNADSDSKALPLRLKDDVYTASIPASTSGFYELVLVINNGQWMTTVYLAAGKKVELTVEFDGSSIVERSTSDNRALSALNSLVTANNRKIWLVSGMSDNELRAVVEECFTVSDSIIRTAKPSVAVASYLRALAYTSAQHLYSLIPRAQGREVPFAKEEVLPSNGHVLFDNEQAILIPSVRQQIYSDVVAKAGTGLSAKLAVLYDEYKCEAVRLKVSDVLVERFLSLNNYAMNFDGGLRHLENAVKKYNLSERFIDEYMKHKAMLVGADFPENVVLVDAKGREVDFSTFKGKYVYIDMWASWCAPCCNEVSYLQSLEKNFKRDDVVFVSISTDTDPDAWRAKMEELDMHGNQLIDRDGELCAMLNVASIPFFAIYDKEGKLHTYGAMRPSSGHHLKQYLQDLP